MSKIRLKYDIIAQRAVDTESGVNIDEALRRRKVEIQNISNSLNQTNYEVQELGETVTSAAAIAASMEGRLSAVEDDVDDLTNEKMDKSSSADFYPRYSNPEGYLTSASLDRYATKEYVEENTSAFLTSADLSNYATEQWVEEQDYLTSADLDDYVTEQYLENALEPYATSAWVEENFQPSGDYVTEEDLGDSLEDYYKKNETSGKAELSAEFSKYQPSGHYVTSAGLDDKLHDYATSAWVESQGYLTSVPEEYVTDSELTTVLADYAEKTDVEESIASATSALMPKSSSADFYPSSNPSAFIDASYLNDYATETYVDTGLGNTSAWAEATFASASQLDDYYLASNPSGYITESDLVQADWTEDDTTSKSYIQNKPEPLALKGDSGVKVTETENSIVISVSADFATKGYVDDGLADKVDKVTGMGLSHEDFTSAYKDKLDAIEAGAQVNVQSDWAEDDENSDAYIANKPEKLSMAAGEGISITEDDNTLTFSVSADYATETYVQEQTSGKVDKVNGMGLSHEDFTSAYKDKLDHIESSANKNVQSDWTEDDETSDAFIQNKPEHISLKGINGIEITESDDKLYVGVSADFAMNDDLNYVSAHIPSLAGYATERYVQQQTSGKVDKVDGKDLSTNDFTDALKDKLDAIEDDAQKNVQSDWEVVDTTSDAYIKNKPAPLSMAAGEGIRIVESDNTVTFSVSASYAAASALDYVSAGVDYVSGALEDYATTQDLQTGLADKVDKVEGKGLSTNDYDDAASAKLYGIQAGAEVNVQSDWEQSDNAADDFIKNKPTPISMAAGNGISITEANDTVTFAVTDAIATSAWVASNFASAAQLSDYATTQYVDDGLDDKLDKTESANYWPQATANDVIPAGTDASNQLVNELGLAEALANFGGFKKSTPDASGKPTENVPNTKTIYLTHVDSATGPDMYNEWIWDSAGNDYELIGDTTLDLTGYATETYVDQHTSGKIDWASSGQFYLASNPDGFIDSTALEPYAQTTYVDAGLNKKFDTSAMSAYAESAWVAANFQSAGQFVTSAGFNEAIEEYYKKTETSGAAELTAEFAKYQLEGDYVTSAGLTEKLNETSAWANETFQSVGSYATTTDLDNTSAWTKATFASASQLDDYYPNTNPSAFITNAALTGLATETYVQTQTSGKLDKSSSGAFYLATNPDHFVSSGELATLSAKIESDIPSLNGYATEQWVGQQGYLTSVPSEYVTDTEMGTAIENATSGKMDKSTSAQFYPRSTNPEHYVTSGELSTLSAKIEGDIPSIAGLAAVSWVQANFASASQISDMATQTWVGQQDFATNDDVDFVSGGVNYVSAALAGYATTSDLNDKVDKVTGKGLSTNDYDDAASAKLFSIAPSAEVNVQSDWNVTNSALDSYIWNKPDIIVPLASTSFSAPKKLVVVSSMPAAANIDPDTIYLVKENVS